MFGGRPTFEPGDVVEVEVGRYKGRQGVIDSVVPFKTCRLEMPGPKYGTKMLTEDIPLDNVKKLENTQYETTIEEDREFMQPADAQPGMFWANKFKYQLEFKTVGKLFGDFFWLPPITNLVPSELREANEPDYYKADNRYRVVNAGEARARDREEEVQRRPKPVELEKVEDFESRVRDGFFEQQAISVLKERPPEPPPPSFLLVTPPRP